MAYKILIVDDSSIVRSVLKKTIGMAEVPTEEIFEAGDGNEALELLKQQQIDLILADLNMPGMNGSEMIEHILADEKTCHIPVVVISTEASTTRIDQLQARGVRKYLHKPFTPEVVRDVLFDVLGICSA